jgi:hypothetical protein
VIQVAKEDTMKNPKRYLLLAASIASLAVMLSFTGVPRAVADSMKPILAQIVNTVGVNVLNTPTVNLNGTPGVAVVNSHPVTIQGIPTVQIANDEFAPLAVQTPVNVFQAQIPVTVPNGQLTGNNSFSVAGHRLVIEYVAVVAANVGSTDAVFATFQTSTTGGPVQYPLAMVRVPAPTPSNDFYTTGQQVRVYADPGTQVFCLLSHTDLTQSIAGTCSFSGYFVQVP